MQKKNKIAHFPTILDSSIIIPVIQKPFFQTKTATSILVEEGVETICLFLQTRICPT